MFVTNFIHFKKKGCASLVKQNEKYLYRSLDINMIYKCKSIYYGTIKKIIPEIKLFIRRHKLQMLKTAKNINFQFFVYLHFVADSVSVFVHLDFVAVLVFSIISHPNRSDMFTMSACNNLYNTYGTTKLSCLHLSVVSRVRY